MFKKSTSFLLSAMLVLLNTAVFAGDKKDKTDFIFAAISNGILI